MGGGGAQAATFSSALPIAIPATGTQGDASPYPSDIRVAGMTGPVTKVNLTLNGFHHTYTQDVEILLAGPRGQRSVLMGDVGTQDVTPAPVVNLSFDDGGPLIPCFTQDNVPLLAGVYRPTLYPIGDSQGHCISRLGATGFDAPAPAGPYTAGLGVFNGRDPNGTWHLYVRDADSGNTGAIDGGWTLFLTIAPPTLTAPRLTGAAEVGKKLTARSGTIGNGGVASYRWNRCGAGGGACRPIARAVRARYAPVEADRGHTLTVTETATNSGGRVSASSAPTEVVGPALLSSSGTKRSQRVLRTKGLVVSLRSNIAGSLTARATVNAPAIRFKTVKRKLTAGKRTNLKLRLLAGSRGALGSGQKLRAKVTLTVKDARGGKVTERLTVRLMT